MNHTAVVAAIPIAALAACAGPRWTVAPPAEAVVFVDGRQAGAGPGPEAISMPLRYYGTTAVDALPAPDPDFPTAPLRQLTVTDEPASPWLFPLDFPIECVVRLFADTPPVPLAVGLRTNPPTEVGDEPADLDLIRARAFAARTSR